MKLKKPIVIKITEAENAVDLAMRIHEGPSKHPNSVAIGRTLIDGQANDQLTSGLEENGIDWNIWLPPQPFKIAGRECEFNADGTVKLSCGTVISNAEIEEFEKRRAEVKQEWPKYFLEGSSGRVWRAVSAIDGGAFFNPDQGKWSQQGGTPVCEWAERFNWKSITRIHAITIVGANNIDR